jgi:uncharacterized membrane protein required for colicin V production
VNSFYFDLVAVGLILINLALGWRFGILGRALALGGLYGGVAAATAMGNGILRFFWGNGAAEDFYNSAWMFIGITFGVVAAVEILGGLYRDRMDKVISLMFDRTSGLIAGLVIGVLEAAVVVMVALAVGNAHTDIGSLQQLPSHHEDTAKAVRNSLISSHIAGLNPAMQTFFGPALPDSLSGHFADTTAPTPAPR